MSNRLPFSVSKTESFYEKLGDWIGDVFYDILPESGFEIRDEQIYMAFQLEKAFKEKKVMFAEAGVGTGKTIAYLLYAICYARYTNRPAIIACADETLIEQLVKKEGDIAKIEAALGLNMDVRLAKSRDSYLCLNKLESAMAREEENVFQEVFHGLPDFVHGKGSMQTFTHYGDRKDFAHLQDEQWEQIAWDSVQDCFSCHQRHRCGQTLHRDYYRNAKDIIICSHDFYMEHIWTKESRKREGQLPLLPEGSCVIFDEGHLLEYACQKALTYRFTEQTLEKLLSKIMANDVREKTLLLIEDAIFESESFFTLLENVSQSTLGSEKHKVEKTKNVLHSASKLLTILQQVEEELVFESELYVINEYDLKIVEEYLEQITYSLSLFLKGQKGITWFEHHHGERTLVIMPKLVEDIMRQEVFSQEKPYIFSSATLSDDQSFNYIAQSLGIDDYLHFSVASPFDYDDNMKIIMPTFSNDRLDEKLRYVKEEILRSEGRALLLLNNTEEMKQVKAYLKELPFPIYFEGDAEISTLVSNFQNDEHSVLCSIHLWEGLDVPGRSLENVIIYSLPYPPIDPVFEAKREGATNPFEEVDLPYMILRLRQGIGRLIRSHDDKGTIHILMDENMNEKVLHKINSILPISKNGDGEDR
ncbi:ATP-dependent DNA helicase [Bacillus sp. CGMCC 1.16607]|uniref:ATP-dependent DNA helicase n=1 Tax=Bacillus sp. CGMCC 1.16607 TaxID=3351842 RepID=UPI0036436FC3